MARSLRDLVDYLLGEVSLCGNRGASLADVLGFIDDFYAVPAKATGTTENYVSHAGGAGRLPNLDRRFKSKVWTWLTRHPDVSVGRGREGNSLSLDEMESRCQTSQTLAPVADFAPEDQERDGSVAPSTLAAAPQGQDELRVFVSEEMMWLAITGHQPDTSRVMPFEFALLSIIASRKGDGVLQTDLVKLSGQDKRSVPKRTDVLQRKGYIEKRPVQYKSIRTSLCILRKFSGSTAQGPRHEAGIIDLKAFLDNLLNCLKEFTIISMDDMVAKLGIERRFVTKAVKRLETIGCVRRVRAFSQYSDVIKTRYLSVIPIREPTEVDREVFLHDTRNLTTSNEEDDLDNLEAEENRAAEAFESQGAPQGEQVIEEIGRVLPQWAPGTNLANVIARLVHQSGPKGMTNIELTRASMGIFMKRMVETTVSRLIKAGQSSHSPHLRHLSLVRDTTVEGTQTYFLHYTFRNFATLVNEGKASWEALESSGKRGVDSLPIETGAQFDEYGFPVNSTPPVGLLNNGNVSLRECVQVANPTAYKPTGHDPEPVVLDDGTYTVQYGGSYSTIKKRKHIDLFADERNDSTVDQTLEVAAQPKPRKKQKSDPFAGMSEKERLEAHGFDGSWTEYSLLCLDRPGPGVYITPYGKRRPVGKARGRPGKSRIAVFKSEKLHDLDWFLMPEQEKLSSPKTCLENTEKKGSEPVQQGDPSPTPRPRRSRPARTAAASRDYRALSLTPDGSENEFNVIEEKAIRTTAKAPVKRKQPETVGEDQEATEKPVRRRGRPPKKRKTEDQDNLADIRAQAEAMDTTGSRRSYIPERQLEEKTQKGSKDVDPFAEPMQVDEPPDQGIHAAEVADDVQEEPSIIDEDAQVVSGARNGKTSDIGQPVVSDELSAGPAAREGVPGREAESVVPSVEPSAAPVPQNSKYVTGRSPSVPRSSVTRGPTADTETHASSVLKRERQSEVGSIAGNPRPRIMKRDIKGGSVALLRRNIVMDILRKCGGAYPMGAETWYPFVEAWQKTRFTEKPDKKTIKTTVDTLIESGKVRQYTFSGKNSKGIIVTKSLIAEAALGSDDPVITNLQTAMLNADPQFYFPPGIEVEASYRKPQKGPQKSRPKVPDLENTDVTVTLQQTPLRIQKHEGRLEMRKQREIDRRARQAQGQRVRRLKSLNQRRIQGGTYLGPLVFATPLIAPAVPFLPPLNVERRKTNKLVADGLAMLMAPRQGFHPATGTFGTGLRIPRGRPVFTPLSTYAKPHQRIPQRLLPATTPGTGDPVLHQLRFPAPTATDTPASRLFGEVDAVEQWELINGPSFQAPGPDGNSQLMFINHVITGPFESIPLQYPSTFVSDIPVSSEKFVEPSDIRQSARRHLPPLRPYILPRTAPVDPYQFNFQPRAAKPARADRINRKSAHDRGTTIRRQRHVKAFPPEKAQKLMIAMIVVRTLAGGLDAKLVEWPLVAPLFPEFSVEFIQGRGKSLLAKHRLQMAKMQSDFQERFAEAYEKDEVPRIEFNNLEAYDWEWLIKWTEEQLEAPSEEQAPTLPANRAQFDRLFEIREESVQKMDEIYQSGSGPTIPRKQALFSSVPLSIPLKPSFSKVDDKSRAADAHRLKVAKTWLRANVVTPDELYRPLDATIIIGNLGGDLIDRAVNSLVAERVLMMGNGGRITPGRNYHLTDSFMQTLTRKRPIELAQLVRAVHFKTTILDDHFRSDGKYEVPYSAEDGDILALVNLAHEGRIVLVSKDPPKTKYGFTGNTYLTRMMDKTKLRFTVEVRPVKDSYVYGDPIRGLVDNVAVPRGELGTADAPSPALGKIPLWFDVHGRFMKSMWDLILCAVLGSLTVRPGLSAEGIVGMLQPCLGSWEVELVLEWLGQVGVVQPIRNVANVHNNGVVGWRTTEWWWMAVK